MTTDTAIKKPERLLYHHIRLFEKDCSKCACRVWRGAGYSVNGRVKYWACTQCDATQRTVSNVIEILDSKGVGQLQLV